MENKLAIIAIVIDKCEEKVIENVNSLLHEYRDIIVGRMGIPYKERQISLMSVMVDGPEDRINSLSGKLGMISYVSVKTTYSNQKKWILI